MVKRLPGARGTRFTPVVEKLEERAVPAVTVSLASGVLTITGSTGNDTITLSQANGRVSIAGVGTTYATTSVASVVVNAGAGNDTVSLSGLKAQPWSKAVTVRSSGGDDSVKLLDGRTAYFSGTNQTLATTAAGVVTLNTKALDWFDLNIHDAALRQLLKTDYADHVLNRNETIAVLRQAESGSVVTTTEFNDLKAVANNTSLFGSFTYVADLTRDVVLGNSANAHYQGGTLGNLAGGSSGAQLEKLVGKWFLGADHPVASFGGYTVTYVTASGTLFGSGGPKYTDVRQGETGDCYFVGTLAEIALRSPSTIQNMFIVNGDGTYSVKFFQSGTPHWVTVDSKLPTIAGGRFLYANFLDYANSTSNVLWVALAEKAYAQMNETNWLRPSAWGGGVNSYAGIEGGLMSDVTRQVANHVASNYWVQGDADATALANAVSAGKLVGFGSTTNPSNSQVVGNHQYVVIAYNSSTKTVTLFNPWGINNGSSYPGLINLTLSQLAGSFDVWTVG